MKKIVTYLPYAGTIPFVLCVMCLGDNIKQVPFLGSIEKILSIYGLVITSFLAGAHWGQHLLISNVLWSRSLPVLSNMIAILLWLGFLTLNFKMFMGMLATTFIMLLIIDHRLFQLDSITHHYFKMRCLVSTIVFISLVISGMIS